MNFELPIVGLFYRPPAMAIGRLIPLNANLWVRIDPTNPVDSNAIAVDLDLDLLNLTHKPNLRGEIKETFDYYLSRHPEDGLHFEDVERDGIFHLGFLEAPTALKLRTDYPDFQRSSGEFRLGAKAKPFVRFAI